jgi:3-hydroxyisobutyrate dehydrogenase-like beta-hydroxyacid dehydrogenase
MTLPLSFLGLGRMGQPMAMRLVARGYGVTVWNRTAARADELVAAGARRAGTPGEAVRGAQVIVLMLADPEAVERVLFGGDGVLRAAENGALVIDCSTNGPDDARTFAANCISAGFRYVEAPVLGSVKQADTGTLVALAAGDDDAVIQAEPVLRAFASRVMRAGGVGKGSALKLVMNLLVGGLTELLAESIVLAERAGLSRDVVRDTLLDSVLASPFVGYKAPQLLERSYSPLFTTRLMLKDLNLVLHLATELGLTLPATTTIRDIYAKAADEHAEQDFASVREVVK